MKLAVNQLRSSSFAALPAGKTISHLLAELMAVLVLLFLLGSLGSFKDRWDRLNQLK